MANTKSKPLVCGFCGNAFLGWNKPGRANRFCSRSCSARRRVAEANPHWKGGIRVRSNDGRVFIKPNGPRTKYVLRYRVVMEQKLGRSLRSDEIVHHIDGDASNDAPSNLEVMTQSEHAKQHKAQSGKFAAVFG